MSDRDCFLLAIVRMADHGRTGRCDGRIAAHAITELVDRVCGTTDVRSGSMEPEKEGAGRVRKHPPAVARPTEEVQQVQDTGAVKPTGVRA